MYALSFGHTQISEVWNSETTILQIAHQWEAQVLNGLVTCYCCTYPKSATVPTWGDLSLVHPDFHSLVHPLFPSLVHPWKSWSWSWGSSSSLCVHRNMNVIVPPHPTPPVFDHERAVPVPAGQQERWWSCGACVCTGTWALWSHPTPPHR